MTHPEAQPDAGEKVNYREKLHDLEYAQKLSQDILSQLHIRVSERPDTPFYYVLEAELDAYLQFGLLSNICFTLMGLLGGFALGCLTALIQGNLPNEAQVTFRWLAGIVGGVAIIFLILGIVVQVFQTHNKKTWKKERQHQVIESVPLAPVGRTEQDSGSS